MKIEYKNPQKRKGILIWEADVNFLSKKRDFGMKGAGEAEMMERAKKIYGEDALLLPSFGREDVFLVWISHVREWESQKGVEASWSVEAKKNYEDRENGNTIGIFDFSKNISGKKQVKINFSLEAYEVELNTEEWSTKEYNKSSSLYRKYTKSDRWLGQTDDIVSLAKDITKNGSTYFSMAKAIYNWTMENITFREGGGERGAIRVFQSKDGSAAEMSFLCITLMRSVGVPARLVSGAWGEVEKKQDLHFWLEFYLQDVGWVPVDCAKKMFGTLDNKRTIFSKGESIFLERAPENSDFFKINYKKTFFLQPEAVYINKSEEGVLALKQNKYLVVKG